MMKTVTPVEVVKRRTRVLLKALPGAVAGDPSQLHRARVASRRLRELMPLFDGVPPKARRRIRKLTRALGRVREMDVALQLLAHAPRAASESGVDLARQHVEAVRDSRRRTMLRRLEKLDPARLERACERVRIVAANEDGHEVKRRLGRRINLRARRLSAAVAEAGALFATERLHGVRIAAKKLRYALEIAAELGVTEAAQVALAVRKSQITLGAVQDRQVLLRELRKAAGSTQADAARSDLLTVAAETERHARALHGQYLDQRERLAAALASVRQHVLPDLMAARPKRPLRASWSRPLRAVRATSHRG
jgi:CHAD domain-containing protein